MTTRTESTHAELSRGQNDLYRAWRSRIDRYFDQAFELMSREDRVTALSAPDDFWTLLTTLTLSPAQVSSPEQRVRLRGAIRARQLLEERGGCLTAPEIARSLGISRQGVNQRRLAGTLLGLPDGRRFLYPRCQLNAGGTAILPGLAQTLKTLGDVDPWTKFVFLVSGQDALDSAAPIDALTGGSIEPVLRAARLHGTQDAV